MVENKSSLLGIIAIIIGVSGLGLGAFSIINFQIVEGPQGPPGQDGIDGVDGMDGIDGKNATDGQDGQDAPGYFCTSGVEVQNAIDAIGSGSGTIIITNDINLSTTINVDQGGDYIIQGNGTITIDCGGDRTAFDITNVKTCTIRDLKIKGSEIVGYTQIILINETNDNPIYIQNVQVIGRAVHNSWGIGILVDSDNVWIQNCYFTYLFRGIQLYYNSESCHILDNSIESISDVAIYLLQSDFNTLSSNAIDNVSSAAYGILLVNANNNALIGNMIKDFYSNEHASGIHLQNSSYNTLSCNVIDNISTNSTQVYGIKLTSGANNNILTGNIIKDVYSNSGAFGIVLNDGGFNIVSSNSVYDVYSNSSFACGIRVDTSYLNILSGNVVNNVYAYSPYACGFDIAWDCEYITLSDNTVINIYSDSGNAYGMTIWTCNYSTLSSNTVNNVYSSAYDAYGIRLWGMYTNNNTILGNMIAHINPAGDGYGIHLSLYANYNNVIGNIATDIKTDGIYIDPSSIGNQEALNLE